MVWTLPQRDASCKETLCRLPQQGTGNRRCELRRKQGTWTGAIASMGLKWPQLSDLKGWQNEAGQLYGITSIPATLLIDKQGKIVAFGLRGAELEAKVAELLK